MRRTRAAALSAAGVVVLVLAGCGGRPDTVPPTSSASPATAPTSGLPGSPAPSPAIAVACTTAQELTAAGSPQRAVALVDALNAQVPDASPACLPEYAVALARVEQATQLVAEAEATDDPESKRDLAQRALVVDRQNTQAQELVDARDPTPVQRRAQWWEAFATDPLTPLSALAVRALVLVTALLVLARLSVGIFPDHGRTRPKVAAGVWYAGMGAVVTGSALAVALYDEPGTGHWGAIGAALAAAGTVMTGWGAARRLRLRVTATTAGTPDDAAAAHVLALLDDLGASPPQGLERPQGADVQGLAAVLDAIPDNPVAKALKSVVTAITGWQPWQVRVDQESGGTVAVAITRNGRTRGGAVIDARAMDLPDSVAKDDKPAGDAHRFVAAVVITELARHHAGFEGLCGASDWQALGMHYLATTDYKDDGPTSTELLSRAVERDPANMLAQVALASSLWRQSTDPDQLRRYLEWLEQAHERMTSPHPAWQRSAARAGYQHLRARVQMPRAAVSLNAAFREAFDTGRKVDLTVARSQVTQLCIELHDLGRGSARAWASPWLVASRATAAAYTLLWGGPREFAAGETRISADLAHDLEHAWDSLLRGPKAHYMRGCSLATAALVTGTELDPAAPVPAEHLREAADELVQGAALPRLRTWLTRDPQLHGFRETVAYREVFAPEPRTDLLALAPFADVADVLRPLNLDRASAWAHLSPEQVAAVAGISRARAGLLSDLAELARSMEPSETLAPLAIELLALLHAKGLRRYADLAALDRAAGRRLAAELARQLHAYVRTDTPTARQLEDTLTAWLHRPPRW